MQTYIGARQLAGDFPVALFRIGTRRGQVYIGVTRAGSGNEDRAIVEVRGDALLGLWRNAMGGETPDTRAQWLPATVLNKDNRIGGDVFMPGENDPMPVAAVHCHVRSRLKAQRVNGTAALQPTTQPCVSVINGDARMMWLASNGAMRFPVECTVAQAPLLARLAGAPRSHWMRVSELLPG
jgi:hypothetical protein